MTKRNSAFVRTARVLDVKPLLDDLELIHNRLKPAIDAAAILEIEIKNKSPSLLLSNKLLERLEEIEGRLLVFEDKLRGAKNNE